MTDGPDGSVAPPSTAAAGLPVPDPRQIERTVQRVLEADLPKARAQAIAPHLVQVTAAMWQGPLPPPPALREYDDIVPGAAKAIVDSFVEEGPHRRKQEQFASRLQAVGMACGALILAGMIALSAYALSQGMELAGLTIPGTMAAVATVFILRQQRPAAATKTEPAPMNRAARRNRDRGR